uniref:Uncharacterized protein n=1 Tax=Arundo donax TaxID=35708 RepID=A0A0A9AYR9_ARUDO
MDPVETSKRLCV